jgi:2-keto-4-pentenoate hydratase/2-oxohepta-3-ene-1,7-dioic acid hydratase in catechol pathway
LYDESTVLGIDHWVATELGWPQWWSWEQALPTGGEAWLQLCDLIGQLRPTQLPASVTRLDLAEVKLLPPVARPNKLLLLAGNYAEHVREQGGDATEKLWTYPYVFSKPPTTTLVGCGTPFVIPRISPAKMDHEVELAVVIGRTARAVAASVALEHVLGYTVVNDISDRGFRPNPQREVRPRDGFFDWLHGKWHDGSCPCGPCLLTADAVPNPQALPMSLSIDGDTRQSGNTSQMIFSVAELIEFISSFVTLEPGDIIATGTPAGVGNATGRYLRAGQTMTASIDPIGQLVTPLVDAAD